MSDKMVSVVNRICEKASQATDLYREGDEFYFRFLGKQMSASFGGDGLYRLYIYPEWGVSSRELAEHLAWAGGDYKPTLVYSAAKEEPELAAALRRLHASLAELYYNMDDFFDDVLNS